MSVASAPQGEGDDDDDDGIMLGIVPDPPPPPVAVAAGRRRRGPAGPAAREGAFWSWLISDADASPPACVDTLPAFAEPLAAKAVVGLVHVAWRFAEPDDTSRAEHARLQPAPGPRPRRAQPPWGFIQYRMEQAVTLAVPLALPDDFDSANAFVGRRLRDLCVGCSLTDGDSTCGEYLVHHLPHVALSVLTLESCVASAAVAAGSAMIAHSVALTSRGVASALVLAQPERSLVNRWRAELLDRNRMQAQDQAAAAEDPWARIALELPERRAQEVNAFQNAAAGSLPGKHYPRDPIHVIRSLGFSKFIRNQKRFSEALDAADGFSLKAELGAAPARDHADDIARTNRQIGDKRVDVLGMLLQRREFRANRLLDRILLINLFTDASPVTGEELQGMIMEQVFTNKEVQRDTLPGSTLRYGQLSAISKGVALLYSLWLVAGPYFVDIAFCVAKVKAICTDFGNETRTVHLPDIVQAFLHWMEGFDLVACRMFVRHDRRLFYRALRLAGWSHLWGNIIKKMAHSLGLVWERVESQVRACASFLRNATWRKWWKTSLEGTGEDTTSLDHAPTSMVKWRYETVCTVFRELAPMRRLFQHHFHREAWVDPDGRADISAVVEASKDPFLWDFVEHSSRIVWEPCAHNRRWGMICTCPEHVQQRLQGVKHITCKYSGRRLPEAASYVDQEVLAAREGARSLMLPHVGNNRDVFKAVKKLLQKKGF